MIASLRGTLLATGSGWIVVDVGGVGYRVDVPASLARQAHLGETIFLHTHLVVREDAQILFGFDSAEALDLFTILIGVNGVGPRSALGVLSALMPAEVAQAVAAEDDAPFRKVSGIGPKTAKLIVVSLAGKLDHIVAAPTSHSPAVSADASPVTAQVIAGLSGLGWSESDAQWAVDQAREDGAGELAPELLRAALALLQRSGRHT